MVWAIPISLAATQGIFLISFPLCTEMFHFHRFAPAQNSGSLKKLWSGQEDLNLQPLGELDQALYH